MNATRIAQLISNSREQATEISDPLSATDLASVASKLGVGFNEIYVCPGAGETIRISVPVSVPIRTVPMGNRAS